VGSEERRPADFLTRLPLRKIAHRVKGAPGSGFPQPPSAMPHKNGTAMPQMETLKAARRERRKIERSVSMPVSSSKSKMPSCATASSMAFWAGSPETAGAAGQARSGQAPRDREGCRQLAGP
jgi:hypothetical protein